MPRENEPPTEILHWVAHQVHPRARVTAVAPLPGGITADMDRVTVDSPAGLNGVVLRRWPGEDWAEGLVAREASALAAVRGSGVPAPHVRAHRADRHDLALSGTEGRFGALGLTAGQGSAAEDTFSGTIDTDW